MKAIRLEQTGPPENLKIVDLSLPEVGENDVLIKVDCAGLMYADAEQRRGTYYIQTKLPWVPGREVAGKIVEVGRRVKRLEPGMRVAALVLNGGGYAEYVVIPTTHYTFPSAISVPAGEILQIPDNISFSQALVYLTNFRLAHVLLHGCARVPKRATILIHGASGGFGSMLTQAARLNDNLIIALCRSKTEISFCRDHGAEFAFDITAGEYVDAVLDITNGRGVDFSLNGVAGLTLDKDPKVVCTFGEIVAYGYVGGKSAFHPFATTKSLSLKTFGADDFLKTEHFPKATEAMYGIFRTGRVMDITRAFKLEDACEAHRWIEEGKAMGKIALTTEQ